MDLDSKIVEIAKTLIKRKSLVGLNDKGISQKFEVSEKDAKRVRDLIRAFNIFSITSKIENGLVYSARTPSFLLTLKS
jgi:transcription initiation factor IIE alpha subunit